MSRRQPSRPGVLSRVWSKAFASGRRKAQATSRPRFKPRLEYLEDRLVPAVIDVTTLADGTGTGTLRWAVAQANANDAAGTTSNTIDLTVAGTYNIGQLGALSIFSNAKANQSGLNLTIQNTSGGTVAINGDGISRVIDINPNDITPANNVVLGAVTINGVTIENGLAQPGDGATGSGGGIRDQGPVDLTLNNDAVINSNATADGGGISMENAASTKWKLTLNNTTVANNHAGDAGGGIDEDGTGTVNINGSTIIGNTTLNQGAGIWLDAINGGTANLNITKSFIAENTAGMLAGGVGNAGNGAVSIVNSTVESNSTSGFGGGFADQNNLGTLTVQNSQFLNNSAGTNGGAIQEGNVLVVIASEIKGNSAGVNGGMPIGTTGNGKPNPVMGSGGGLFVDGGSLTLTLSTIADNTASINGGGVELETTRSSVIRISTITGNTALNNAGGNDGGGIDDVATGMVSLANDTINGNFADHGGGVFYGGKAGLTIQNTIIAQNIASTSGPDTQFATSPTGTVDLGGNLIGIGTPTIFKAATTQQGTASKPLNPMLAGLADNGGQLAGSPGHQLVVETEALLPGSPALGKGVSNYITIDERVFPRAATPDVGAFQFQNVTLAVQISVAPIVTLHGTENITITVTNTSNTPLPADNGTLTLTTSGGLNLGGTQTVTLGALGAGKSVNFTFYALATAMGQQTITASVTTPDTKPLTVSQSATVTVTQPALTPSTSLAPAGGFTLFGFGLGPTGLDLFEVDSMGEVFAVPLLGGSPMLLNTSLQLPFAASVDGFLLAQLASSSGQDYMIDIFSPFSTFVESAVLAALQHG